MYCPLLGPLLLPFARSSSSLPTAALRAFFAPTNATANLQPSIAATWVHYNTFVKLTTVSVSKLLYMYKLLGDEERREFLEKITQIATSANQ